MFLAFKEMMKEKKRYGLIIAIITLIAYLVFFLLGLAYGLAKDNTTEIDRWQGQAMILAEGSNKNLLVSRIDPVIKEDYSDQEASLVTVSRAVAYLFEKEDEENTENIVVVGMRDDAKAYPEILEGRLPENSGEILADLNFKDELEMNLGDRIKLASNGQVFEIVGFTQAVKYSVSPVIYTDLVTASPRSLTANESPDLIDYADQAQPMPDQVGGLILHEDLDLQTEGDYEKVAMADFIQALPGYRAQNLTFGMMIGFLVLITAIVLGVFMYIITNQKRQTFAIMKIQGIANGFIGRSVLVQTLLLTILGLAIGALLTFASEQILPVAVPFRSDWRYFAAIAGLILVFTLLGALFSVASVAKVDPLEVLE
ncbi:TPA: ABC transporter permease [Streptococcus suis]